MITVNNVGLRYGDHKLFEDVNIGVKRFYAVQFTLLFTVCRKLYRERKYYEKDSFFN